MPEGNTPKAHALVFPYPYQGHITPTFNLAEKLASDGFAVTFVLPEFLRHHGAESRDGGVRFATISDGFPEEFDRILNLEEYWESMIADFPARVDEFVGSVRESNEAATGIFLVADTLYTWPADIATKHGLVHVSFWTAPALVFNIGDSLDLLRRNGHYPYEGSSVDDINYIPGVESIRTTDLMSNVQQPNAVPIISKLFEMAFEQVNKADFLLCNTVEELESNCLSALHQRRPTYAVGPVGSSSSNNTLLLRGGSDCSSWLDSKPPASVLYISLGTIFEFNDEELGETAHALLSTRVNFLWVLNVESKGAALPKGFLDGVAGRGLVVPWCDQRAVLSSPAVGGFLTHCGWNSTLESMESGVPMLCHPFSVDQPTNRRLVVEEWRIGIDLCKGGKVTREEVSRKIEDVMKDKRGDELKQEVKKVREIVRSAVGKEGSSVKNYDRFVRDLKSRLHGIKEEGLEK